MKKLVLIALMLTLLINCREEEPLPIPEIREAPDCRLNLDDKSLFYPDFPTVGADYEVKLADTFFSSIHVSSLNENRILLWMGINITVVDDISRLAVFDMSTGHTSAIGTFEPTATPDWNQSERVVFTGQDDQLYLVNADGNDLKKITSSDRNFEPVWSPDGSKICFHRYFPNAPDPKNNRYDVISDTEGNIVDTFRSLLGFCKWPVDSIILVGGRTLFFNRNDRTNFNIPMSLPASVSITMGPARTILYTTMEGSIYSYDFDTKEITLFKKGCRAHKFNSISYAPGRDKYIVGMVKLVETGPQKLKEIFELYTMDPDGSHLKLVKAFR